MGKFVNSIIGGPVTSAANTAISTTITDAELESLNIIFESVAGNFPAGPLNASVDVSIDGTNFHNIDNAIALTAGVAKVSKFYSPVTVGAQQAVNPLGFKAIKITVPALTGSIQGKITWSGKRKFY
jgi:hypothetical protein